MWDEVLNVLVFLAQGFEDLEAVTILDVFGWTEYREHIPKVLVTTAGFHEIVRGRFGISIRPNILFSEINYRNYQALVLPGGFHSHGYDEAYDKRIYKLAREIHQNGGYIATMCVGILPVAKAGLLRGKVATTYPYSLNHDNIGELEEAGAKIVKKHVVMDDRIISCDGPGASLEVAFLLMECLIGTEITREVRSYVIFNTRS